VQQKLTAEQVKVIKITLRQMWWRVLVKSARLSGEYYALF